MRALLLLVPALARADVRVEGHVAAGMEGGMISGEARPDGVGEYGAGVTWFAQTKGVGLVVERVGRLSHELPTQSETKLDVIFAVRSRVRPFTAGFGAGLRRIEIAGEPDRRGSTLWGADLMRLQGAARIAAIGPVAIDLYFAWTFGLVKGEVYGMRHGDAPYPVEDYFATASSYVVGIGTSFETQP